MEKCLKFCHEVLEAPDMVDKLERAIISNQDQKKDMLPEAACAFIRHAFNAFYHDFANVEKGHILIWQKVYYRALTSFRRAATRYAGKIRIQHTHRIYTDLTAEVSEESRKKFEQNNRNRHHRGLGAQARLQRRDHSSTDQPQGCIRRGHEEPCDSTK